MITSPIKIALVDDHTLFRMGVAELINGFADCEVMLEEENGHEFLQKVSNGLLPDIVLLDIKMPKMDGFEVAEILKKSYPTIKILALTMYDDGEKILRMLKLGANGYILKDAEPRELKQAIDDVVRKGFYYSELVSSKLIKNINQETGNKMKPVIKDREREFLKLASTNLTYKEIASKMCVASRTVDGYREALFEKLNAKNRTVLVINALRSGYIDLD